MERKKILLIVLIIVSIVIIGLYGTFALTDNGLSDNTNYDYEFIIGNTTENELLLTSSQTKTIDIKITNPHEGTLNYGLAYNNENKEKIKIGVLNTSTNNAQSSIEENDTKTVSLIIKNLTEDEVRIKIYLITGYVNGGELILEENQTLISEIMSINNVLNTNLDESGANAPKLTEEMIPVYYDNIGESWSIADKSNTNLDYEWYDYNNKKWANVVLVNNPDKYKKLSIGDNISEEDIKAFFVWIPRFKYKVWNLNSEEESSYNALSSGVGIAFEKDASSTGQITCTDDKCVGNASEYYTHPAFKLGDKELTGFWVGKFETTGSSDNLTILPGESALTNLNIEDQFNASRKYSTSTLDSHLSRDFEWNAISYLANSIYGICNGTRSGCRNIYRNNSTYFNTGSNAGDYSTNSEYGSYSYKGYLLNEYGTEDKNLKTDYIGSTTGNIYGVYDLVGGAYESVMATNNKENEQLKNIDEKYYDILNNSQGTTDIIEETDLEPGYFIVKGGSYNEVNASLFTTSNYSGKVEPNVGFRIILS